MGCHSLHVGESSSASDCSDSQIGQVWRIHFAKRVLPKRVTFSLTASGWPGCDCENRALTSLSVLIGVSLIHMIQQLWYGLSRIARMDTVGGSFFSVLTADSPRSFFRASGLRQDLCSCAGEPHPPRPLASNSSLNLPTKALHRPGARLRQKRRSSPAGNVSGNFAEVIRILLSALPMGQPVERLAHP